MGAAAVAPVAAAERVAAATVEALREAATKGAPTEAASKAEQGGARAADVYEMAGSDIRPKEPHEQARATT